MKKNKNTLYILDKNAIIHISAYNKDHSDKRFIQEIDFLKNIDDSTNYIGSFSSIIEGNNLYSLNKHITSEEQSENDLKSIGDFFCNARTDSLDFYKEKLNVLRNAIFFNSLQGKNSYDFLFFVHKEFHDKKNNKEFTIKNITEYYKKNNVSPYLFLIVLSCIFGNTNAVNLLKINKSKYDEKIIYNSLADLVHILFTITVRGIFVNKESRSYKRVEFVSFDKGLKEIEKIVKRIIVFRDEMVTNQGISTRFGICGAIPKALIPGANKRDIEYLNNSLRGKFIFSTV